MGHRPHGTLQKLDDGRWRLFAEAGIHPETGRRRRVSKIVTAPNRRAALGLLAEHVAAVNAGEHELPSRRTVNDALDAFLAQTTAEPNTVHEWRGALDRYIRPHIGDVLVVDLELRTLEQLYRQLQIDGGAKSKPLAASTVRKVHVPLRLALAQAVRWKWMPTNPAAEITPPAARPKTVTPPDATAVAELERLADELDKDWACALRLLAHTGMRRGELCGLRWSDIDLDGGELGVRRVARRVGNTIEVAEYPKNASSRRRLALGPNIVVVLVAHRARQRAAALSAGVRARDGFVFTNDPAGREPWHPVVLTHRFTRLRNRAGQPNVRLHDLRHYMATRWLSDGVDVRTVAGRGGWANANTLLSTYAHWVPARDREAAQRLDDAG